MRFSIANDDVQAVLATSRSSNNAAKPVSGTKESAADLEIPEEARDLKLNEAADRLPPDSRRQKRQRTTN